MTRRNRLIVVGLGAIGQELLERLSRDIEIVCVDIDPEASA
ncbi:MAG: NAD-binding protein, partial [Thermodesulfovibrionales bacterium]